MSSYDSNEGWLITRREPFRKPIVTINARTKPGGSISAEILDQKNNVIAGFSRDQCVPFEGDSVRHRLQWTTSSFAAGAMKSDYKIRFWLKNAELFPYLPDSLDPNQRDLARFQSTGP